MPSVSQRDLVRTVLETEIIVVVDGAGGQNSHERLGLLTTPHQTLTGLPGATFVHLDQRLVLLDPPEEGTDADQVEVSGSHDGEHPVTGVEGGELAIDWQNALHDAGPVCDVEQAGRLEGRVRLGRGAIAGTEHREELEEHGGFQGGGCARQGVVPGLVGNQVVEAGVVFAEADALAPLGETVDHREAFVARRHLDQAVSIDGQVGDGVRADELVAPDPVQPVEGAVQALITKEGVEAEEVKDLEVHWVCLVLDVETA